MDVLPLGQRLIISNARHNTANGAPDRLDQPLTDFYYDENGLKG